MLLLILKLFSNSFISYLTDGPGSLGPELELDGQLLDELPEEVGVAVLGELVEDEPVSNL